MKIGLRLRCSGGKYQPELKCIKYLEMQRTLEQKEPLRSPSSTALLSTGGKQNPERLSDSPQVAQL